MAAGTCRDNGKEHSNYYLGLRDWDLGFRDITTNHGRSSGKRTWKIKWNWDYKGGL